MALLPSSDFCFLRFENDLFILVLIRRDLKLENSLTKHNTEIPRYFSMQGFGVTVNVVTVLERACYQCASIAVDLGPEGTHDWLCHRLIKTKEKHALFIY